MIATGASTLLLISGVLLPLNVHAEKNLDEVKDEQKDVKKDLSDAETEVADILIEIDDMNNEIAELDSILEANQQEINKTEDEIDELEKEIKKLEDKIEERFDILKDRAKSYQENGGNINYLEVILGAKDFSEFISRVSAMTKIADSDADLIEEQEEDKQKVENKLEEAEELKEELKAIEEKMEDQKSSKKEQKDALKEKESELKDTVKKLELKDDKLSDLEEKIISEQSESAGVSFSADSGNGELGWPTDGGYISSPMKMRWGKQHKGIDIARTDRSTSPPIYAAESGTIESAGFNSGGYGNMVMINHGNGLKTLYGHMSSIKVSDGQKVERGEQIGVMGSTGNSTGIHLHFEVHKNGDIQNPVGYLNE